MDGQVVESPVKTQDLIKARFVGGPWHNQVREVPRQPFLDVSAKLIADADESPVRLASRHFLGRYRYRLVRSETPIGTAFWQYLLIGWPAELLSEECHA